MRRLPPQRADELGHPDTWSMLVIGETFHAEDSEVALLGWMAHPVRYSPGGAAYMCIDSIGSDQARIRSGWACCIDRCGGMALSPQSPCSHGVLFWFTCWRTTSVRKYGSQPGWGVICTHEKHFPSARNCAWSSAPCGTSCDIAYGRLLQRVRWHSGQAGGEADHEYAEAKDWHEQMERPFSTTLGSLWLPIRHAHLDRWFFGSACARPPRDWWFQRSDHLSQRSSQEYQLHVEHGHCQCQCPLQRTWWPRRQASLLAISDEGIQAQLHRSPGSTNRSWIVLQWQYPEILHGPPRWTVWHWALVRPWDSIRRWSQRQRIQVCSFALPSGSLWSAKTPCSMWCRSPFILGPCVPRAALGPSRSC